MSPIIYIEARCDECDAEIQSSNVDAEFALLRNGHLLCKSCGDQKADRVQKWFTVAKLTDEPEAKGDPTAEEVMKDIESLEETPEEEPRGIPPVAAFSCKKCTEIILIEQRGETLKHPTECPTCKFTVFEYVPEESLWETPEEEPEPDE